MSERPYVVLSVAASIDSYIDDNNAERLYLSNEADFDRVDEVRAGVDAVLIGTNTVRRDDPRLRIRSQERRDRPPSWSTRFIWRLHRSSSATPPLLGWWYPGRSPRTPGIG